MKILIHYFDSKIPILNLISEKHRFNENPTVGILKPFLVSDISKADVILIAHDAIDIGKNSEYLRKISKLSETLPVLIFDCGDIPFNIKIKNVYSLRTNFPPNIKTERAIPIPYNVKSRQHIGFRGYGKIPTISFVGFTPRILSRRLIPSSVIQLKHPIINNGSIVRKIGLRKLSSMDRSIVIARSHYGGAKSLIENLHKFEKDYENSIKDADFIFAPRGDANQSARYFEALSAGRIPVVPNTSIIFPSIPKDFNDEVKILVSPLSIDLRESVERFWQSVDKDSWHEIQQHNRKIFKDVLEYGKFLTRIFELEVSELDKIQFRNEFASGNP